MLMSNSLWGNLGAALGGVFPTTNGSYDKALEQAQYQQAEYYQLQAQQQAQDAADYYKGAQLQIDNSTYTITTTDNTSIYPGSGTSITIDGTSKPSTTQGYDWIQIEGTPVQPDPYIPEKQCFPQYPDPFIQKKPPFDPKPPAEIDPELLKKYLELFGEKMDEAFQGSPPQAAPAPEAPSVELPHPEPRPKRCIRLRRATA
jgi:type II secretory pathway pseudopilin PulG